MFVWVGVGEGCVCVGWGGVGECFCVGKGRRLFVCAAGVAGGGNERR